MAEESLHQETEPSVMDFLYNAQNQGEVTGEVETAKEPVTETAAESETESEEQGTVLEASGEVEEAEPEDEGETISSTSELIEHLEADPEWFDGLKVSVKVNGKPAEATLKDLVSSYQTQEAANDRLAIAKQESTALRQEAIEHRDSAKQELGTAAGLTLLAKQLFAQDAQAIEALKDTDNEQYLLQKESLRERAAVLQQAENQIRESLQAATQISPEVIKEEYGNLIEKMPSLEEDDARARLYQYVTDAGFTAEQVEANPWHQLYIFAEKARLYDEMQGKNQASKKKIAKIPKIVKPTQPERPVIDSDDHATILYGNK